MCLGCWEDEGRPFKVTELVKEWTSKFADADPFGPLHIVVGDWNLEDTNLEFCRRQDGVTDADKALMDAMFQMSWDERWATAILASYPNFDPRS